MSLSVELEIASVGKYQQPIGLFINGKWVEGVEKRKFDVFNPSNEELLVSVCEATEKDVDIAVAAARAAFEDGPWKNFPSAQKGRCLSKLADLIEKKAGLFAAIESADNGKTVPNARGDVGAVIDCLRYYAGWADKIDGKTLNVDPAMLHLTLTEPIGVCGQIIPWNFPLLMLAWKAGPALATGNTVVMKSAEQTPLSALLFASLFEEAGFPPGVFNMISGFGRVAGAAMSSHMDIDKIAFTGSTIVGREIMKAAAGSNLKKVTLELGGKSPNIVFDDADIEKAVTWAVFGVFFNHGQACCAGSRVYVQEGIYDSFLALLRAKVKEISIGPAESETLVGPFISKVQFDRVMEYIGVGNEEGAVLETGGKRHGTKGYFIEPTIFSNVGSHMRIAKEEIFGPVGVVAKFKDEKEVIRLANDSVYGLAAAVHTTDLDKAISVSRALKAGTVWVNCYNLIHTAVPFGGYKQSGIGRELGEAAMGNYLQSKSVSVLLKS